MGSGVDAQSGLLQRLSMLGTSMHGMKCVVHHSLGMHAALSRQSFLGRPGDFDQAPKNALADMQVLHGAGVG